MLEEIPDNFEIPNPYNIPMKIQGDENNCTSLTFADMYDYVLSDYFKERTLIDIEDLWNKQKELGTATEEGDIAEGPFNIAIQYGVTFTTDSGKTGTLFLTGEKRQIGFITQYVGTIIKLDNPLIKIFRLFKRKKKERSLEKSIKIFLFETRLLFRGVVGRINGFQFVVYSNDHDKHFHVIHKSRGIDARFSFPEIKLMNYKGFSNTISSKEEKVIIKFFKDQRNFEKLQDQFKKR